MALALGTNVGFVTVAPTADPSGPSTAGVDGWLLGQLDTSPAAPARIVEVGWWCNNATQAADFEVGLYSDAGNGEPETRLEVSTGHPKGTGAGWKVVTGLAWDIDPSTNYWIAFQLDDTTTQTDTDYTTASGPGFASKNGAQTALPADWGTSNNKIDPGMVPIYARWELVTEGGVTMSGVLVKRADKLPDGSIAPSGLPVLQPATQFAGLVTPTGEPIKQPHKLPDGSIGASGGIVQQPNTEFSGTLPAAGTITRDASKLVAGSITPTGDPIKQPQKLFAGTLGLAGVLSTVKTLLLSVAGSLGMSGALTKQAQKTPGGTVGAAGTVGKSVSQLLAGTLTLAGAPTKLVSKLWSGLLTLAGTLANESIGDLKLHGPFGAEWTDPEQAAAWTDPEHGSLWTDPEHGAEWR